MEELRKRLRRWLIGYDVNNMTVEVTVDISKAMENLKAFEAELDRIMAKAEKADALLRRFGR